MKNFAAEYPDFPFLQVPLAKLREMPILQARLAKFTVSADGNFVQPKENLTSTYIANVSRLTGIPPDEPIGIPSDQPARWMAVGVAMAIQENGTESLDYFAMLRGWTLARDPSVLRQAQEPFR